MDGDQGEPILRCQSRIVERLIAEGAEFAVLETGQERAWKGIEKEGRREWGTAAESRQKSFKKRN